MAAEAPSRDGLGRALLEAARVGDAAEAARVLAAGAPLGSVNKVSRLAPRVSALGTFGKGGSYATWCVFAANGCPRAGCWAGNSRAGAGQVDGDGHCLPGWPHERGNLASGPRSEAGA